MKPDLKTILSLVLSIGSASGDAELEIPETGKIILKTVTKKLIRTLNR